MVYFIEISNRKICININRENILLLGDHLKLADLGSCKGIYSKHPYTEYISTRFNY